LFPRQPSSNCRCAIGGGFEKKRGKGHQLLTTQGTGVRNDRYR
jgi:hypothetical protein